MTYQELTQVKRLLRPLIGPQGSLRPRCTAPGQWVVDYAVGSSPPSTLTRLEQALNIASAIKHFHNQTKTT